MLRARCREHPSRDIKVGSVKQTFSCICVCMLCVWLRSRDVID
jgi:hypothetical protein